MLVRYVSAHCYSLTHSMTMQKVGLPMLSVQEADPCLICDGKGTWVEKTETSDGVELVSKVCHTCKGKGVIEPEDDFDFGGDEDDEDY